MRARLSYLDPPMAGYVLLGSRRSLSIGLPLAIALATVAGFAVVAHQTGATVLHAAATPNWFLLGAALAIPQASSRSGPGHGRRRSPLPSASQPSTRPPPSARSSTP